MEVFGAVASAVALIEVSSKGVSILREIPGIQDRFKELCEEIQDIKHLLHELQSMCVPAPRSTDVLDAFEKIQIGRVKDRLESIEKELRDIKEKCEKRKFDDVVKADKLKWIRKRTNIDQLLNKARQAKSDLMGVRVGMMTRQNNEVMRTVKALERSQPEMMGILVSLSSHVTSHLPVTIPPRIQELPEQTTETDEDEEEQEDDDDDEPIENAELATVSRMPHTGVPSQTQVRVDGLVARGKQKCAKTCRCRCHIKPTRFRSPRWASGVLGEWDVSYLAFSGQPGAEWDLRCGCDLSGSLYAEYRPPKWGWLNFFFSQKSYGLRCALRPTRVLPTNHSVWFLLKRPAENLRKVTEQGNIFYPDDCQESGVGLVGIAMIHWNLEAVELLLEMWANILSHEKLRREVGFRLTYFWRRDRNRLNDREVMLFHRIASCVGDGVELNGERSRLHVAAETGCGVGEALERLEDRSAIDELDDSGCSALQLASINGRVEAVRALVDAGADVNVKNVNGWTPLMVAAENDETAIMGILVQAKARVGEKDKVGRTALHYAAEWGSLNGVDLLLHCGASVSAVDIEGETPLHKLARCKIGDPETLKNMTHRLLEAGPDILESRNKTGHTPMMLALVEDNLPVIRALVATGASLQTINQYTQNLLHTAAGYGSSDALQFLLGLNQSAFRGIDVRLRDTGNGAPWDFFIFCSVAEPWNLGSRRRPSQDDASAFVQLFQYIRDANFGHEIAQLRQILNLLSSDTTTASSRLASLSKQSADSGNHGLAQWYRAVQQKVQSGETDSAVADLEDYLQDLQDQLQTDPWDQPSQGVIWRPITTENEGVQNDQSDESDCSDKGDYSSMQNDEEESRSDESEEDDDDTSDTEVQDVN